jgi:23S rRNA U2552 (ribose-2'-O)-methylase RlmE/FtsJ
MNFGDAPIKTFHLAEGPGGFIEATAALRGNSSDVYVGMTLQDASASTDIPSWKKSNVFLKENPNVIIENGANGTGDILSVDNFVYCCEKYRSSMEFITGDGGFDFTENFNEQEQDIGKLLFAQIAFAVCMQKHRGTFVLKIFDFFLPHTIDLLFLLSSFYEKVYITKPDTSRYANSEKYLVCTGFRYENCDAFYPVFLGVFISVVSVPCESAASVPYESVAPSLKVVRFLNKPISYFFKMKLEEFNSCFGQQQIESIFLTITIIECNNEKNKTNKINELIKNNMQKCMNWCIKYNVPYNVF